MTADHSIPHATSPTDGRPAVQGKGQLRREMKQKALSVRACLNYGTLKYKMCVF